MIGAGSAFLLALLVSARSAPDSLALVARQLSDSALVARAKDDPLAARDAVTDLLANAVHGPAAQRAEEIAVAQRVAAAYAEAWRDSLLVRQTLKFSVSSARRQSAKVTADSLRRAGVAMYPKRGPAAAITIWRRALSGALAIGDSAGAAATLGNIGAAFARLDALDSAEQSLGRARRIARMVGDARVEASALGELAGIREARGDGVAAHELYASAIPLQERIGDTRGLAADYNNLGLLAQHSGAIDEAQAQFGAALAINRRAGRDVVAATNLVNLAGVAGLRGDFGRADSLLRDALATWRAHDQDTDVADALRALGELTVRRGDYRSARASFGEALTIYERNGLLDDALGVRREIADALAASGQLQSAIDELRRVQRLADSAHAAPAVTASLALSRADLAWQLGERSEAQRLYSSAQSLYRRGGDRGGEAEAMRGLGQLSLDADDARHALTSFDAALRGELSARDVRAASVTRLFIGRADAELGDSTSARREYARAASDLARVGDPVAGAAALGEEAALEAASGLPNAAESLYVAALHRLGDRVAPQVSWQLHAGLGALRRSSGALDDAEQELQGAIADVERSSRSMALPEQRSAFLADKAEAYLRLALLERSRGRIGDAFEVSERTRSREMLELLAQGRIAAPPDTSAGLVAREQDLRRHIDELMRDLESPDSGRQMLRGPELSRGRDATREALVRDQDQYSALLLEMRERAPRQASLVAPSGVTWRDVARQLAPDDAFIEYLVSDSTSLAFVITRDTIAAVDLGTGRAALAHTIDFARGTLEPRGNPRLDSLWRAPLRQLYHDLISPIEGTGLLAGKTRLIVVPHAELHYLPMAALLDPRSGRYLVERYELSVTPSAAVWLALGARNARRDARGGTGLGLLALAPRPDLLPASRHEVEAIAQLQGSNSRVLIGPAATEAAFRQEAPTRRVLHLATYGVLNRQNPLFSFVELAPAGGDGRLEVHDIFGLQLSADLVVLSACQTGLASGDQSDVPAGDDWIGLARAFLHAGASHVAASLWPVNDRATSRLMEEFYRAYATGQSPASALAVAQRALLHEAGTKAPFYWAAFEVVGQ